MSAQASLLLTLQTLLFVSESRLVHSTRLTFVADVLCQEVHRDLTVTCGTSDVWCETCLLLWTHHVDARYGPINGVCDSVWL